MKEQLVTSSQLFLLQVTWLKNGGPLSVIPGEVTGRLGMTLDNDLILNNIDFSDQGRYTCKGSNIHGDAVNTTVITVVRKYNILHYLSNISWLGATFD